MGPPLLLALLVVGCVVGNVCATHNYKLDWMGNVTDPNPSNHDFGHFGQTVDVAGAWSVVGAPETDGAMRGAGTAYVYHKDSDSEWVYSQTLDTPVTDHQGMGSSVAMSGDWLVVSAPSSGNSYVFVYKRTDGVYTLTNTFTHPDPSTQYYGTSVAMYIHPDPDTEGPNETDGFIVVGSPTDNYGSGAALVYLLADGAWQYQDTLAASTHLDTDGQAYGYTVDVYNTTAVLACETEGYAAMFEYRTPDGCEAGNPVWQGTDTFQVPDCPGSLSLSLYVAPPTEDGIVPIDFLAIGCPSYVPLITHPRPAPNVSGCDSACPSTHPSPAPSATASASGATLKGDDSPTGK
ncbi:hypothetical protein KIPB_003526 [Kipferlia bialata]|uniref:Uncharacterized protein n=1 Tax=Kipferlia bialata TaxID=797122 RepID=A0A9K3CT25_9EUKA|nr:hypothetical protein KIPB_003526 [Kipferlia bialata]|eukprot:g3526.t1